MNDNDTITVELTPMQLLYITAAIGGTSVPAQADAVRSHTPPVLLRLYPQGMYPLHTRCAGNWLADQLMGPGFISPYLALSSLCEKNLIIAPPRSRGLELRCR